MEKIKELLKKVLSDKIGRIVGVVVIVAIVLIVILLCISTKKEKVDTEYLIAKLQSASELTTAKLNFTGMSKYEDKGVAIINKSNFIMVFEATARAGIDVKEIKIKSDDFNKKVIVEIPEAEILDVKVDLNSIKYFDQKFALFNFNSKEDANKANALVEEKAKEEVAEMGILDYANSQSEILIKGLLQDSIPKDYTLEVKIANK